MLQQWQAVGNTLSDLTCQRFEPQTFRSRDERVTAQPTSLRLILQYSANYATLNSLAKKAQMQCLDYNCILQYISIVTIFFIKLEYTKMPRLSYTFQISLFCLSVIFIIIFYNSLAF